MPRLVPLSVGGVHASDVAPGETPSPAPAAAISGHRTPVQRRDSRSEQQRHGADLARRHLARLIHDSEHSSEETCARALGRDRSYVHARLGEDADLQITAGDLAALAGSGQRHIARAFAHYLLALADSAAPARNLRAPLEQLELAAVVSVGDLARTTRDALQDGRIDAREAGAIRAQADRLVDAARAVGERAGEMAGGQS